MQLVMQIFQDVISVQNQNVVVVNQIFIEKMENVILEKIVIHIVKNGIIMDVFNVLLLHSFLKMIKFVN
jgi:hypothetical protein